MPYCCLLFYVSGIEALELLAADALDAQTRHGPAVTTTTLIYRQTPQQAGVVTSTYIVKHQKTG